MSARIPLNFLLSIFGSIFLLFSYSTSATGQNKRLKVYQVTYQVQPFSKEYVGLLNEVKDSSLVFTLHTNYPKNLLRQFRRNSLRLKEDQLKEVPFSQFKKLKIKKKGAVWNGFFIGAVVGTGLGIAAANLIHGDLGEHDGAIAKQFSLGTGVAVGTIITSMIIAGAGVKVPIGHEKGLYLRDWERLKKIAILR